MINETFDTQVSCIYAVRIIGLNSDSQKTYDKKLEFPMSVENINDIIKEMKENKVIGLRCMAFALIGEVDLLADINKACEYFVSKSVKPRLFDLVTGAHCIDVDNLTTIDSALECTREIKANSFEDAVRELVISEHEELEGLPSSISEYVDFRGILEDIISQYMSWIYDEDTNTLLTIFDEV